MPSYTMPNACVINKVSIRVLIVLSFLVKSSKGTHTRHIYDGLYAQPMITGKNTI